MAVRHIFGALASCLLLMGSVVQGFLVTTPIASSIRPAPTTVWAELGELSSPNMPSFDPMLIEDAQKKLLWENKTTSDSSLWKSGQLWSLTRETLVDLWILPRDMSNGADGRYAAAATKSELKILVKAPQLLRLDPTQIIASAKFLLKAKLPPALMRSEPSLLCYPAEYLESSLQSLMELNSEGDVIRACRDTPRLLVAVVEELVAAEFQDAQL